MSDEKKQEQDKTAKKPIPGLLVEDTTKAGAIDPKTGKPIIVVKPLKGKVIEAKPTDPNE